MLNNPKMEVENLDLYYGNQQALKKVSLSFPANRISALIGPSGCGKSTLLRTLNRMNDLIPECRIAGSVRLDGEEILGDIDTVELRRRVGMVFQKPNPFPFSIFDNVAYGPRVGGIRNRGELEEIVEKNETTKIACQFCDQIYEFSPAEISEILEEMKNEKIST